MLVALTACGGGSDQTRRSFVAGEAIGRFDDGTIELVNVTYGPKHLIATVRIANRGPRALELDHEGFLIQYGPLEYPARRADPSEPTTVQVPPGEQIQIVLDFALGQPVGAEGLLFFRSARRGDAWVRDIKVAVPPPVMAIDSP